MYIKLTGSGGRSAWLTAAAPVVTAEPSPELAAASAKPQARPDETKELAE